MRFMSRMSRSASFTVGLGYGNDNLPKPPAKLEEKGKKYLDKLIVLPKSIALEKDSIVNCDEIRCKVHKYD